MFCPKCGRENNEYSKFCSVCGNNLESINNSTIDNNTNNINLNKKEIVNEKNNITNQDKISNKKKRYVNESLIVKISFALVIWFPIIVVCLCLFFAFLVGGVWIQFMIVVLPIAIIYAIFSSIKDPTITYTCPKCNRQWHTYLSKVSSAPYGKFKSTCKYCFSECILDVDSKTVVVEENDNE